MKVDKFQWGLKSSIHSRVASLCEMTYMGVLNCALIVEREYEQFTHARE